MKTFFAGLLAVLVVLRAQAQVSVEMDMDQEQFLPSESIKLAVKITNRSGQKLHLGAEDNWLTFNVESADGFVVIKNGEVPVRGAFELESSQMAIKRVDLQPNFVVTKPGRYKVIATLRIKDWAAEMASSPKYFDVISGVALWSQDFGVVTTPGSAPEPLKYTLMKASYLRDQLRLYVQISDPSLSQIKKVAALGSMVSFGRPEAMVDRSSRLHVLWQTGSQTFSFVVVNPDGTLARQELYDIFDSIRPRLSVAGNGDVVILGGVRRKTPGEFPQVKAPNELPPLAPTPAK